MKNIPRKLDLGCGENKPKGFWGVDHIETDDADQVIDLESSDWNLPSNYFEQIRAKDLFEHIENPINFMEEIFRIAKPGCEIFISAPHQSSQNWTDPTHKRLVGLRTIENYFTSDGQFCFYSKAEFEVDSAKIVFQKRKAFFYNYLIEPIVNSSYFAKYFYERSILSRLFPAKDIVFRMRVDDVET